MRYFSDCVRTSIKNAYLLILLFIIFISHVYYILYMYARKTFQREKYFAVSNYLIKVVVCESSICHSLLIVNNNN